MQRIEKMLLFLFAALVGMTGRAGATSAVTPAPDATGRAQVSSNYGRLPLSFEINRGQTDSRVRFLARGEGYGLFLTPREAVLRLRAAQPNAVQAEARKPGTGNGARAPAAARSAVVRMRLARANADPEIYGLDPLPGTSNYFIGNDPAKWQTEVAHYERVKYAAVYPGIDLIYYGNQRQLEYDFVVTPGADPTRIELVFEGARKLSLDRQGNLILATAGGELVQHKPVVYQETDGKRTEVNGRYVLRGRNRAGIHIASYDVRLPLVIDPVLSYSNYLGGSGDDSGYGIAVDANGNAYVTGYTASVNFPAVAGYIGKYAGGVADAFVTKFNATGTALIYSTFLGGTSDDKALAIAVDAKGNAYVTGYTSSSNFPTTAGALQISLSGTSDAFVTKLGANGATLAYSTLLGGNGAEAANGIAVDASGNAYVTGDTNSSNFPTLGAYQVRYGGGQDAFVTKLNAAGSALVYSTFLGGQSVEAGLAIAVDASGNAYVTGFTASSNFPVLGAYQGAYGGGSADAFVTKLNAAGSALAYSTLLGGSGADEGYGIAVDAGGNAYVTGYTASGNFPTSGAYQSVYGGGGADAFVTKLNAAGSALAYSTLLGGSGVDQGYAVAVDASGNAHVAGFTASSNFPTLGAYQSVYGGGPFDAFVIKLNAAGNALVYATFLGGRGDDTGLGIALDATGSVYVTGATASSNFPTPGANQPVYGGATDAFVAKISGPPQCTLTASPGSIIVGQSASLTAACNPVATSYAWTNTGFAATASSGSVTPRVTTIYSVTGSNAIGSGNTATATVTAIINASTPLPPPPATQAVFVATTGTLPAAAVTVSPGGTFGNATLAVRLDLSKILSGGALAGLEQYAAGDNSRDAASYNVYVVAFVPGEVLGLPSAILFMLPATRIWAVLSFPMAAFMEGLAQNATNSVLISILEGANITGLAGTEFYIGYGTSDIEMIEAKRFRGVYIVN